MIYSPATAEANVWRAGGQWPERRLFKRRHRHCSGMIVRYHLNGRTAVAVGPSQTPSFLSSVESASRLRGRRPPRSNNTASSELSSGREGQELDCGGQRHYRAVQSRVFRRPLLAREHSCQLHHKVACKLHPVCFSPPSPTTPQKQIAINWME